MEDLDQILHEDVALNTLLYGSNTENFNLNTSFFQNSTQIHFQDKTFYLPITKGHIISWI